MAKLRKCSITFSISMVMLNKNCHTCCYTAMLYTMVSNTAALELCFMLSRIHSSPDKAIASPSLAPPPPLLLHRLERRKAAGNLSYLALSLSLEHHVKLN